MVVKNQQTVHWGSLSSRAELRLLQLGSLEHHQNAPEKTHADLKRNKHRELSRNYQQFMTAKLVELSLLWFMVAISNNIELVRWLYYIF